jgi:hypothetical protein
MLPHPKLISVAGIILLTALATPALAGTLYKWTAEDGSVAFTDDAKRVPERYRSQVKTIQTGGLDSYQRFTPEDSAAVASQRADLAARLERLRERSAVPAVTPVAAPQRAPEGAVTETLVQLNDETAVRIPVNSSDEEPIVVEEVRVLRHGSNFTIHDTVVRQGDKVLMVVRPDQRWPVRPDYIDEDDLFE